MQITSQMVELALGRIFRMGSRPYQDGDLEDYYRCREIIMDYAEQEQMQSTNNRPNYARDHRRGAQGD